MAGSGGLEDVLVTLLTLVPVGFEISLAIRKGNHNANHEAVASLHQPNGEILLTANGGGALEAVEGLRAKVETISDGWHA